MHKLNNTWCLWYHSTNDNDWSINSYKRITGIDTIEKFWETYQYITPNLIQNGMFFLMKDGIQPIWEDSENKSGGCWSFKIIKKDIYNSWLELSIHLLGGYILKSTNDVSQINGISVSPKRSFCIIKIWNKDSKNSNNNLLSTNIPYLYICDSIYKSHESKS